MRGFIIKGGVLLRVEAPLSLDTSSSALLLLYSVCVNVKQRPDVNKDRVKSNAPATKKERKKKEETNISQKFRPKKKKKKKKKKNTHHLHLILIQA